MRLLATALMMSIPAIGFAQDTESTLTELVMEQLLGEVRPTGWSPIESGVSKADVLKRLMSAGWASEALGELQQAEQYDIYTQAVAPGISKYLVLPESEQPQPLEFSPPEPYLTQAYWPTGLWLDIGEKVRKLACSQNIRPATVTATADLGDTGPLDLVWETETLCKDFKN